MYLFICIHLYILYYNQYINNDQDVQYCLVSCKNKFNNNNSLIFTPLDKLKASPTLYLHCNSKILRMTYA